jgi:hypothetical protein
MFKNLFPKGNDRDDESHAAVQVIDRYLNDEAALRLIIDQVNVDTVTQYASEFAKAIVLHAPGVKNYNLSEILKASQKHIVLRTILTSSGMDKKRANQFVARYTIKDFASAGGGPFTVMLMEKCIGI